MKITKNISRLVVAIFVVGFVTLFSMLFLRSFKKVSYAYMEDEVLENEIVNSKWEEYNALSDEEKNEWEVVPEKYIVPFKSKQKAITRGVKAGGNELPSSFDLRNVGGKSFVTPAVSQGGLGVCWSFAAMTSVESNILMSGLREPDNSTDENPNADLLLAERQLDYASVYPKLQESYIGVETQPIAEGYNIYTDYDTYSLGRNLGSGGSTKVSFYHYLTTGLSGYLQGGVWGDVYDGRSCLEYDSEDNCIRRNEEIVKTMDLADVFGESVSNFVVTDYIDIPSLVSDDEQDKKDYYDMIKQLIMKYGAVDVSFVRRYGATIRRGDYTIINDLGTQGLGGNVSGSHAVAIIGWDDDFEQNYCLVKSGADNNYRWYNNYDVLYPTKEACEAVSVVDGYPKTKWITINGAWILKNSNRFEYDKPSWLAYDSIYDVSVVAKKTVERDFDNTYISYFSGKSNTKVFYKSQTEEKLKRVSFKTTTQDEITFTAFLIKENDERIELGTTEVIDLPGRYSIDVDDDVYLRGSSFEIEIVASDNSNTTYLDAFTDYAEEDGEFESIAQITKTDATTYKYQNKTSHGINGTKINITIEDALGNIVSLVNNTDKRDKEYASDYGYLVGNFDKRTIKTNTEIGEGLYYLKSYMNDELVGTDVFSFGITLSGDGTEDSPYLINSIQDFDYMFTSEYGNSYFKLNTDLDLENIENFEGINSEDFNYMFNGVLDGDGHIISNMKQDGKTGGFFKKISGTVKNLIFDNADVSTNNYGDVLAAEAVNAKITNVKIDGKISTNNSLAVNGGLVGKAINTTINQVYNKATIDGGKSGAIVGLLMKESSIRNAINLGGYLNSGIVESSFVGEIAKENNRMEYLIDYYGRDFEGCLVEEANDYPVNQLVINNVFYYKNSDCNYLGTGLTYNEVRTIAEYNDFDDDVWKIMEGELPTLKSIPLDLIFGFNVEQLPSELKQGNQYDIKVTVLPQGVMGDYVIISSDETVVKVVDGKIAALREGQSVVSVVAMDGSQSKEDILVKVSNESKVEDDSDIIVPNTGVFSGNNNGQNGLFLAIIILVGISILVIVKMQRKTKVRFTRK